MGAVLRGVEYYTPRERKGRSYPPKRGYYMVETEMRALNKIATLGDEQPSQPKSSASNYSLPKKCENYARIIHGALIPSLSNTRGLDGRNYDNWRLKNIITRHPRSWDGRYY